MSVISGPVAAGGSGPNDDPIRDRRSVILERLAVRGQMCDEMDTYCGPRVPI